ncbi:MAG TPA: YqzL family protein [Candidatus Angelobacter sp.]|nr:YqzL family protein [Candidatus Angelobacter sp.]
MLDFTWKVFCMTGNIDTYLLYKELTDEGDEAEPFEEVPFEDHPIH